MWDALPTAAGVLLLGGSCCVRAVERKEHRREDRRLCRASAGPERFQMTCIASPANLMMSPPWPSTQSISLAK